MPNKILKATDEELISAYAELKSVWSVGRRFGMCGQSVHERLKKLGANNSVNIFSTEDDAVLLVKYQLHADSGELDVLAASMGRTRQFICRQARRLGLTDRARPKSYLSESSSENMKRWHANNPHPRGMLGKTHSQRVREIVSRQSTERWQGMTEDERAAQVLKGMKTKAAKGTLAGHKKHGSWRSAWREIGGQRCFFRSMWEANYARYLQWLLEHGEIAKWEHEPETFWFEAIKRGVRSYLPDFRITENDGRIVYHEVKGWMDDRSKTTIARMARYHPTIALIVIDGPAYKKLAKDISRLIPGWETSATTLSAASEAKAAA